MDKHFKRFMLWFKKLNKSFMKTSWSTCTTPITGTNVDKQIMWPRT